MSRRLTIIVTLIAAAIFAVVYFWPEDVEAGSGVSVTGRLHLGDGAVNLDARIGAGTHRDNARGPRNRWHPRHGSHRRARPLLVVPYAPPRERVIVRETVVTPPPAPVAAAPAPPPEPLDPRGHARTVPARGAGLPREWVLGDVLPADLPHVALEPDVYGLPQPPSGQIYARVDGDVLRIDASTRRIVAVVAR